MPKKTRRQKILAKKRRHFLSAVTPNSQPIQTPSPTATFHFNVSHEPIKSVSSADDREELTVIKKDLTKTLVFALIAVAIELGLYRMLNGI
jgi:hypothetical protein